MNETLPAGRIHQATASRGALLIPGLESRSSSALRDSVPGTTSSSEEGFVKNEFSSRARVEGRFHVAACVPDFCRGCHATPKSPVKPPRWSSSRRRSLLGLCAFGRICPAFLGHQFSRNPARRSPVLRGLKSLERRRPAIFSPWPEGTPDRRGAANWRHVGF